MEEQFQLQTWYDLQPATGSKPTLPIFTEHHMVELAWPPWYTRAIWDWASTLSWPSEPANHGLQGVTYLELLVNFVVVSGCLPPKLQGKPGLGTYIDLATGAGRLLPFALKELLVTFLKASRPIKRVIGGSLLPAAAHHRIQTLSMFEDCSRKGLVGRPVMACLGETGHLLRDYLSSKNIESLRP